jgi:hypothetical protein
MAKKNLYAVIDTASGIYDGPIPGVADAHMIRSFCDMAIDAEHPIGKHPEHFALIKVGIWNDGTGEVEDIQNTTMITGLEAVAASRSPDEVAKNMELVKNAPGGTA